MDRARFERLLVRRADRRRLLFGGAGLVAVSLAGAPTRARGQATPAGSPSASPSASPVAGGASFALGVASGDPLADSVVLWTRLAPDPINGGGMEGQGPVEVRWELAADQAFGRIVQQGTATASPDLAHSVHVDVQGLAPGAEYFYRFIANGEESPVGRTRTAPAAGAIVDRLRFAFASCQHYEDGYFTAFRRMADEELDLILHLGDYIYEGGVDPEEEAIRRHNGPEIQTLADYRNRYGLYKSDPDLQLAHAAAPWIVTWDDHEVANDYAAALSEDGDPTDLFLERRAAAYQAYYEHMPLRVSSLPQGPTMQLYRRLAWGDLASFQVLDTRQYRTDHPCGEGAQVRCPAATDPNTTMLGPQQEQWLLAGLDASIARWNVLAQSLQMAELEQQVGPGALYWNDSWPGYPAARSRILSHLQSRGTSNPIVLAGDIHCHWANDLKADWTDEGSATIGSEFICTSISSEGDEPSDFFREYLPENPHVRFFDGRHGGYMTAEVTPDAWRTDVRQLDSVTTPDAPIATIASFVVENGSPGLRPA